MQYKKSTKNLFHLTYDNTTYNVKCIYSHTTDKIRIENSIIKTHGGLSAGANKKCAQYLGIFVAERVLAKVFKDVEVMPYGNPGYDFICNKGYKIDVKSSCRRKYIKNYQKDQWGFHIGHNTTADYFLCLGFDNRESLNPEHIWLLPSNVVSHLGGASIAENTLERWEEYEISNKLNDVINCCNIFRGEK